MVGSKSKRINKSKTNRSKTIRRSSGSKKSTKSNKSRGGSSITNARLQRPSPMASATAYPAGKELKGKDGNMWVVKVTSNGIHRWSKINSSVSKTGRQLKPLRQAAFKVKQRDAIKTKSKSSKRQSKSAKQPPDSLYDHTIIKNKSETEYHIHDNGGRPYTVISASDGIRIIYNYDNANNDYGKVILKFPASAKIMPGKDIIYPQYDGNTVLIWLNPSARSAPYNYVYVQRDISKFSTQDPIIGYYSLVGHSNVPYPFAVGTKNVYLMLENKYIEKGYIEGDTPYGIYYNASRDKNNRSLSMFKNFKSSIIYDN